MSKKIYIIIIFLLFGQTSFIFANETPDANDSGGMLPLASGTYSGFEETIYSDTNWVLVVSEVILREDLCVASGPDPYDWYEKVFNPCYWIGDIPKKNNYWKLQTCEENGEAFPLEELSRTGWTLDSLYVREGVGLQLYGPDEQPYGSSMVGPKFISIDIWRDTYPAPDGFEPGTFFVHGIEGDLKDYSIIIYPNILEIDVDILGDPNCVSPSDYITYTIFYTPSECENGPVQLIDYLPDEVDFVQAIPNTGAYEPNNNTYTWNIDTLEPGVTGYVTLEVIVNDAAHPGCTLENRAMMVNNNNWNSLTITDVCCYGGDIIYVDDAADGHNTGTSWANAYYDLQSALLRAETGCGSEIWVAEGQYTPSIFDDSASFNLIDGVSMYGGFAGYESYREERDYIRNETYLTGNDFIQEVIKAENVGHTTILDGFMIINANTDGIDCREADPNIVNCIIADNTWCGVDYDFASEPIIRRCVITGNHTGINCSYSSPTIKECIIKENDYGVSYNYAITISGSKIYNNNKSGIYAHYGDSPGRIVNNQIYGNGEHGISILYSGSVIQNNWIHHNVKSGIDVNRNPTGHNLIIRNNTIVYNSQIGVSKNSSDSTDFVPTITNCIFLGNLGGDLDENYTASYSYFDGGDVGLGNIKSDPNNPPFAYSDPELYNYHLDPNSVCIDVGDSNGISQDEKDIDGDSRVLDGDGDETPEVDMGADESACDDVQNDLDFNGDGIIDWDEFVMFADAWLRDTNDPNWNPHCDLNSDHHVNYVDFAFFGKEWLWQACWRASGTGVWMMMGMGGGESMLISQTATVEAVNEQQATEIQPQAEPSVEEQIEQIKGLLDWLYEAKDTIDEETWLSLVNSLEEMLKELEDSQEGD